MTCQDDFTFPTELLEQVQEQGLEALNEACRLIVAG